MKNLIVSGDSFCASTAADSWLKNKELNNQFNVKAAGFSGQSWWHSRRWLLKELQHINPADTVIVFFHTEANRLPAAGNYPLGIRAIYEYNKDINFVKNFKPEFRPQDPAALYQVAQNFVESEMYDPEFYTWAQESFVRELCHYTKEFYRVLHFCSVGGKVKRQWFDLSVNGLLCPTILRTVSMAEFSQSTSESKMSFADNRSNHFNSINNNNLAQFILNLIALPDANASVSIDTSSWALVSPNIVSEIK